MKVYLCLVLVLSALIAAVPSAAAAPWEQDEQLQLWLQTAVPELLGNHGVPGAAVAVVHEGRLAALDGFGTAHMESQAPVDPIRSVFPAASLSKTLTHAAVIRLAEEGYVDLDDPVRHYITSIELENKFQTPLLVRHLLTHSDGFESRDLRTFTTDDEELEPLASVLERELHSPIRRPGSAVTYGSYSAALAGLLVENVSGQSFADYVQQEIFGPLGMDTATFDQERPLDGVDRVSVYYRENDLLQRAPRLYSHTPPSSGAVLSAMDAAAFLAALTQLDPPDDVENGEENGTEAEDDDEGQQEEGAAEQDPQEEDAVPFAWNEAGQWLSQLLPAEYRHAQHLPGISYGFLETRQAGQTILYRAGSDMGVYTHMLILPEHDIGLVYMQNTKGQDAFTGLLQGLLAEWFPGESSALSEFVWDLDPRPFTGRYRPAQMPEHTLVKLEALAAGELHVERDGSDGLLITPSPRGDIYGRFGEEPSQWRPVAPLTFQRVDGEGLIYFQEDAQGRITALHTTQGYHGSYEPIGRWQSGPIQAAVIIGALIVLALNILVVPVKLLMRRGWRPLQPVPFSVRLVPWWSLLASLLFVGGTIIVFYELFWKQIAGMPGFAAGVSELAQTGLALLILAVGALGVLFLLLLAVWKHPFFHGFSRFWQSVVVLAGITASIWMWHWNVLGQWF